MSFLGTIPQVECDFFCLFHSRNYQRSMRKLDLNQRKGTNRHKVSDPVIAHYDRKMDFALPRIRLDAISKKRTQIEYTSEFQEKFVKPLHSHSLLSCSNLIFRFNLLEHDSSGLGDLQKYLKAGRRDLWLPKEQTKEVERGIWSENYLRKLHETLKVWSCRLSKYPMRFLCAITLTTLNCRTFDESATRSGNFRNVWCMTTRQRPQRVR